MKIHELKGMYGRGDRSAISEAYTEVLKETPGSGEELAFLAADHAHGEALALLFGSGVSPAVSDKYGFNLLHYLARQPESKYNIKPPGAIRKAAEILLDNKVSPLQRDTNENMTCYHYAARNGMAELVEVLAERGTKLNMTDRKGNTGIHIACDHVVHAIRDIGYRKKDLENAEKDHEETVARLKGRGMGDGDIAIYIEKNIRRTPEIVRREYDAAVALVEGYFRTVRTFASAGVDIDEKNEYGRTALDIAVKNDAKKIASYLSGTLTDDADEASIAAGGMTLHQAAEKGDVEAVRAIVAAGADINELSDVKGHRDRGRTPLAITMIYMNNEAAEALLACGADPAFKDGDGNAAIHYLLHTRAVSGRTYDERRIPRFIEAVVGAGMNIDMPINDDGDTLLTETCRMQRGMMHNRRTVKGEILNETMRHRPDINMSDRFGRTALMHTCARDFDVMEQFQITLLELGADVAAVDGNGDTALHYAARNDSKTGAKTLCDMLLDFGAEVNAVNNAGKKALDIAGEQNNEPLVKLLLGKM